MREHMMTPFARHCSLCGEHRNYHRKFWWAFWTWLR